MCTASTLPPHTTERPALPTGLITEKALLEDLESTLPPHTTERPALRPTPRASTRLPLAAFRQVPGAVLCPKLDDEGVLKTVSAIARQHAMFWNMPELSSGALGIKPHNSPWCALRPLASRTLPLTSHARALEPRARH